MADDSDSDTNCIDARMRCVRFPGQLFSFQVLCNAQTRHKQKPCVHPSKLQRCSDPWSHSEYPSHHHKALLDLTISPPHKEWLGGTLHSRSRCLSRKSGLPTQKFKPHRSRPYVRIQMSRTLYTLLSQGLQQLGLLLCHVQQSYYSKASQLPRLCLVDALNRGPGVSCAVALAIFKYTNTTKTQSLRIVFE